MKGLQFEVDFPASGASLGGLTMLIRACIAKIHRATVTEADLDYVGSITVDQTLLDLSGIAPYQFVHVTNVSNGVFWQTYVIPGKVGQICLNGPPARHFHRGDKVVIMAEGFFEPGMLKGFKPAIVIVKNDANTDVELLPYSGGSRCQGRG